LTDDDWGLNFATYTPSLMSTLRVEVSVAATAKGGDTVAEIDCIEGFLFIFSNCLSL